MDRQSRFKTNMQKIRLKISPQGDITFIYCDELAGLLRNGQSEVHRASRVEPHPAGGWTAFMIEDNVTLGPFPLRSDALQAEIAYLEKKIFA